MKKFKISMILAVCLLIISISVVFAAFMFNQAVSSTARVGNIAVDSKKFINYQDSTYEDMRVDTYIRVDDVILESNISYSFTTDTTFQSGKTYYTYDRETNTYTQTTPDFSTDTLYYEGVTASWKDYEICQNSDTGAMLIMTWLTTILGYTIT